MLLSRPLNDFCDRKSYVICQYSVSDYYYALTGHATIVASIEDISLLAMRDSVFRKHPHQNGKKYWALQNSMGADSTPAPSSILKMLFLKLLGHS